MLPSFRFSFQYTAILFGDQFVLFYHKNDVLTFLSVMS